MRSIQFILVVFSSMIVFMCMTSCSSLEEGAPSTATEFLEQANSTLMAEQTNTNRAEWVKNNFITPDTTSLSSKANAKYSALTVKLAHSAKHYKGANTSEQRQLDKLSLMLSMPGPTDSAKNEKLAALMSELGSAYGSGKYCRPSRSKKKKCFGLNDLEKVINESRNPEKLLQAWMGWRTISVPMKAKYAETVRLGNEGAQGLGFKNLADLWKSQYDMAPADFEKSVDKIWSQVKPFYEQLHCYVRAQLNKKYGNKVVSKEGAIPAHLLGNMWAQSWGNIYGLMGMRSGNTTDLTQLLKRSRYNSEKMVRTAENFFVSLGMPQLPKSFYTNSLFEKPRDREVTCHASAWHIDLKDDVRIKMCIKVDRENFRTIHHELGHIYYYLAYKHLPTIFQNSANDGFHEALGDTMELSMTGQYLKDIGLTSSAGAKGKNQEISHLMKLALGKVAFLPFGLLVDKWRWKVFSGEVPVEKYNEAWWALRKKYQGIVPPIERAKTDFDPGAKYHIPGYTPYSRYFLAHILQFQFHRALCKTAGHTGPLHECSIFGSKVAGEKMWKMMQMGSRRPWPEALKVVTGQREMDATAIRDYFAPLEKWLVKKNQGRTCGW